MHGPRIHPRSPRPPRHAGFTLVELVVAFMIIAGLTSAVTIAISQTLKARTASEARQSARIRADAAVSRIALDVHDAVREGDLYHARLLINDATIAGTPRDGLLVFSRSMRNVRPNASLPEGAEFEVQYRLGGGPGDHQSASATRSRTRTASTRDLGQPLWRRVDPIPDEVPEGGGVVFPVVQGITSLSVEAFDSEGWRTTWDSDRDGYPHALRIVASATSDDGRSTQVARRVIALDRVPLPYVAVRPDENEDEEGESQ